MARRVAAAACLASTGATTPAAAGAWLQPADETAVIVKLSAIEAPQAYDLSGHLQPDADFQKNEFEILLEHGLTEDVTVILKPVLQDARAGSRRQSGLASVEIGARTEVWQFEDDSVLGIQASVIAPGRRYERHGALITDGHAAYDLRLLYGEPESLFGLPGYLDTQLAFRHRGGKAADEIRLDTTYAIEVDPGWFIGFQSLTVASIGNAEPPFEPYQLQKFQASIRWEFQPGRHVELGALRTVAGRNIVRETGALIAYWQRF